MVSDDVSVGGVDVTGGSPGDGAGGATGRIRMIAFGDLNVHGSVDASGTGAGGTAPATDAGSIYLRAGNTLTAGTISVAGANGGTRGSRGSRLDLFAHDATIDGIFGDGGSGTGAGNPSGAAARRDRRASHGPARRRDAQLPRRQRQPPRPPRRAAARSTSRRTTSTPTRR